VGGFEGVSAVPPRVLVELPEAGDALGDQLRGSCGQSVGQDLGVRRPQLLVARYPRVLGVRVPC
jgi:hypothetical protein